MFQQLLYIFLIIFISSSNSNRISLIGNNWTITNNINHTAQGTIPGTIHTILFAAKQIPEPYLDYNDLDLRYLIYNNWTFTKKFDLFSDFLTSNQITIHLEQIDTVAAITINNCLIGRTNSMFIPYTFHVANSCLKFENEISVDFESPVLYALKQANTYNDTVPPDCPPSVVRGECYVQFIRKEPSSFGWGFGPTFAPIGITGDIYLEAVNTTEIVIQLESINVASYSVRTKSWQIVVLLSSNNDQFESKIKFILENTTWSYETLVIFNHNLSITVSIPDKLISRWWPNGYGDQSLYNFVVFNREKVIDSRLIGFRTVQLVQNKYRTGINGTSFYFVINSQSIFIKGSNWIPSDSFQERVSNEKYERLLRSVQLANMNMIRVWGGGIYEHNSFYELADRLGIMLWHDFMFACSLYPVNDEFLKNVHDEVIYQVKRLQSHPSIVLWSGNNENEAVIAENWYNVSQEKMNKTKDDYRKLYIHTVMNAIQQVDQGNNRPFVSSSPSNGLETIAENYIAHNPEDSLYGDVHFYGYQIDTWDSTTYPILEATRNISNLYFNSSFIQNRERFPNQLDPMIKQIAMNLPLPITNDPFKNFTQLIYLSQINQAMTLKSISDVCRLHSSVDMINPKTSQGHTMGIMYWQINDMWQAPTWSTIEYGLKWKMGHYYAAHMYTPIYPITTVTPYLANITDENAQLSIDIVNELINGTHGDLTCWIYTLDTMMTRLTFGSSILFNSSGIQNFMNLSYVLLMKRSHCDNNSQCILHCIFNSNHYQVEQTLFLSRLKDYQIMNPNLNIENIEQLSSTDFNITLTVDRPALFVWLDITANVTGYFSRNGFHMFEPKMSINFHSWIPIINFHQANFEIRYTSLFDVTLP
ncbi:unnamed protein product [Rotaria sordida]|uniref:Beta-mannosidase n=1 Tax=Rotaria sordida TaxID=392033 RepID=A0A819DN76_9BILA|nr:unnamed protein product [Rotaria sordida]